MIQYQVLDESLPIEEDDQMEYGFLDEAMQENSTNDDDKEKDGRPTDRAKDDPDNLDDED